MSVDAVGTVRRGRGARKVARQTRSIRMLPPLKRKLPLTEPMTPDQIEKIAKTLPLKKVGRPNDIANAVVFLASDAAGHVTGQVLSVSGGYSMIG